MKGYGYRCETAAGAVIANGAYHHQVVCLPGETLRPRLEHLGGLKPEEIDLGIGLRDAEIAGPV
jgi:hypothetical protein